MCWGGNSSGQMDIPRQLKLKNSYIKKVVNADGLNCAIFLNINIRLKLTKKKNTRMLKCWGNGLKRLEEKENIDQ